MAKQTIISDFLDTNPPKFCMYEVPAMDLSFAETLKLQTVKEKAVNFILADSFADLLLRLINATNNMETSDQNYWVITVKDENGEETIHPKCVDWFEN